MNFNFITFDILVYVCLVLILCIIFLLIWAIRTELRLKRILRGKGSHTFEDSINFLSNEIRNLQGVHNEVEHYLAQAEKRIKRSAQGIATVRFNPFKGTGSGGNQSFATAIIDENGDGVIFSSLYSRDRMSVYSKPLKKHSSEFELSTEEKEAIKKAQDSIGEVTK